MAKINEITDLIQAVAPLEMQEPWDNSGWQIRLQKKDIKKIMLCVSFNSEVLTQAKEKNCDMIIAHHPLIFNKNDFEKPVIKEAIKDHFPVYSIHTPFDKANMGTTDSLVKSCGLEINEAINEYTKISYAQITLKNLVEKIKKGLCIEKVRISNYKPEKVLNKIAFCAGSGTSFLEEVQNANCDCFITADLKYHTALDSDLCIIDVGHLESEKPSLQTIKSILKNVECEIAQESSPILIV